MKKSLLLVALAALSLPAFAATVTIKPAVTALEDGKTYYIYDAHGDDGSATETGVGNRYTFRCDPGVGTQLNGYKLKPANAVGQLTEAKYVWKAVADGDTWTFQNVGTNGWISSGNASVADQANAQKLDVTLRANSTNTFTVGQTGTTNRWDGNAASQTNTAFVYWNGDGHPIQFYTAVCDEEDNTKWDLATETAYEATVSYTIDDKEYAKQDIVALPGATVSLTLPAFCTAETTEVTVTEDDHTFIVPVSVSLPFAVSESLDAAKWQAVYIHSGGWLSNGYNAAWTYNAETGAVNATSVSPTRDAAYDDTNLFAFVGSLQDGFKIYNKAAGANLTLNNSDSDRAMAEGETIFYIKPSRTNSTDTYCCFQAEGGTNLINGQGWGNGAGKLGGWWDADQGSTCWFVAMYEPIAGSFGAIFDVPEGCVGAPVDPSAKAAFDEAIKNFDLYTGEGLDAVKAATEGIETIAFDTDKAYRLRNVANGSYMVAANDANVTTTGTNVKANHNTIVQFVENAPAETTDEGDEELAEPTYTILINGAPMGNCSISTQVTVDETEEPTAAAYRIYNMDDAESIFVFHDSANDAEGVQYPAYGYLHKAGSGNIVGWEPYNNNTQWYLELVTDVEIAATETDNHTVYAAHLPVAVEAAEGTVLSIVEERNGLLDSIPYLAKVAVDMVPANVPFIIDGIEEGSAVALNVVYDRELPDVSKSVLSGVLRAAEVDATTHYVLGENADGELGFFHAEGEGTDSTTIVAHNGVWLHASNTATAEAGGYLLRAAEVGVTGITISETELTLAEGETAALTAAVTPDDAINAETIVWTSSDETVATVADGTVTAVAPGTAVITASANGLEAACTVTVKEESSIAELSAAGAAAAYDLQGRRTVNAAKGIFIINGQKVAK